MKLEELVSGLSFARDPFKIMGRALAIGSCISVYLVTTKYLIRETFKSIKSFYPIKLLLKSYLENSSSLNKYFLSF